MDARTAQALDAAKLYYGLGRSQGDVAEELGVSRPTVSKLIQYAKDQGFVTVSIRDPREVSSHVADELRTRFGLADVRVAVAPDDDELVLAEIGRLGAGLLEELVRDGDVVGLSWGATLYAVARHLRPGTRSGVEIVELKGGIPFHTGRSREHETMSLFCHAFDAAPRSMQLPLFFDRAETRAAVEQDSHVRAVLELGRAAPTAVFTVGGVSPRATMFSLGHLTGAEREHLLRHAAGDIVSRFFSADGSVCLPELDERTVAIPLEELRRKERRICVAGGRHKVRPLEVALRAGYVTHLVTDVHTAERVLELAGARQDVPRPA